MWYIWNEEIALYNLLLNYYLYLVREEPSQETQTWSKRSETLSPPPSKSLQAPTLLEWPLALPYVIAVKQFGIHRNTTIITTNKTSYTTKHGQTLINSHTQHTYHSTPTSYSSSCCTWDPTGTERFSGFQKKFGSMKTYSRWQYYPNLLVRHLFVLARTSV